MKLFISSTLLLALAVCLMPMCDVTCEPEKPCPKDTHKECHVAYYMPMQTGDVMFMMPVEECSCVRN